MPYYVRYVHVEHSFFFFDNLSYEHTGLRSSGNALNLPRRATPLRLLLVVLLGMRRRRRRCITVPLGMGEHRRVRRTHRRRRSRYVRHRCDSNGRHLRLLTVHAGTAVVVVLRVMRVRRAVVPLLLLLVLLVMLRIVVVGGAAASVSVVLVMVVVVLLLGGGGNGLRVHAHRVGAAAKVKVTKVVVVGRRRVEVPAVASSFHWVTFDRIVVI